MSESDGELGKTETLEEALARNFAASSESAIASPQDDDADVTADVSPNGDREADSDAPESLDPLEPLEKWSDEIKQSFASLPRDQQEFLLGRHKDVEGYLTKESQAVAESRKRYERLDDVLKPYDQIARESGLDLTPHVAQALQYYFAFQRNPQETLSALAQSAGLDLAEMANERHVDPDLRELRTKLQNAEREIASLKSHDTGTAQRQIEEFEKAVNDDGTLKYPHFQELRPQMAPLVSNGKSLEDAYKEVLWTLPDYRKQQIEAERKKAQKELEAKRAEKAEKARKASDTLPSSDVEQSTALPKVNGNWEAALKHTMDQMRN